MFFDNKTKKHTHTKYHNIGEGYVVVVMYKTLRKYKKKNTTLNKTFYILHH